MDDEALDRVAIPKGYLTLEVFGSVGRVRREIPGPSSSSFDAFTYSIGTALTLDFSGATSLRELIREYR